MKKDRIQIINIQTLVGEGMYWENSSQEKSKVDKNSKKKRSTRHESGQGAVYLGVFKIMYLSLLRFLLLS